MTRLIGKTEAERQPEKNPAALAQSSPPTALLLEAEERALQLETIEKLVFPECPHPTASVIIPVWNQWRLSYKCLKSVREYSEGLEYQVMVVDNGSSDETASMLEKIENIRVIKNGSNEGFISACNRAAEQASGKYLVFLNNDTLVTNNWLHNLLATAEADPSVGAVGAQLRTPGNQLQEAGCILWKDGSALGYGRGSRPSDPEFEYLREVDFCSGACLLVRREIFFELGGFDPRYAPAYYEDADICMGVRKLGYRVLYNPEVKIIHREYGSSSKSHMTAACLENQKKFFRKWEPVLNKEHREQGANLFLARDRNPGPRLLYIDDLVPASHMGSGFPRTNLMVRLLSEMGYVITFLPTTNPFPYQPYTRELQQLGVEVFYGRSQTTGDFLRARRGLYEIVFLSRPHNAARWAKRLREYFPKARLIYDAEAVYALRDAGKLEIEGQGPSAEEKQAMIEKELEPTRYAHAVITVSDRERERVSGNGKNQVYTWGYPVSCKNSGRTFSKRQDLLFVGGFLQSPSPNEDAVLSFVRDIFPEVRSEAGCNLRIAGTNFLESIKGLQCSAIEVVGYEEDLSGHYTSARIFVCPSRYGAGIPLKLLEAMSHGLPAVVSPLVAAQLGLGEGDGVLTGDDAGDFAAKIIRLYRDQDLWLELQARSYRYIEKTCDINVLKQDLISIMQDAGCPFPPSGKT